MYTTSRSRVLSGLTCPRKRYWGYEHGGTGLVGPGSSISLSRGIALHALLEQQMRTGECLSILQQVQEEFTQTVTKLEALQAWEFDRARTIAQHLFLFEIAARALIPRIHSLLMETYHPVLVEGTHIVPLVEGEVEWYSREDAILLNKKDQTRWIFSFKTAEDFQPYRHLEDAKYAMQNVSEPWAAMQDGYEDIKGVLMLWLETGRLIAKRDEGFYHIENPLIWPWFDPSKGLFYWKYRYNNGGGVSKQIPKAAVKSPVWEMMSAKEWVEMLEQQQVIPNVEDALAERFYGPVVYPFPVEQQEHWLRQMRTGELKHSADSMRAAKLLGQGAIEWWQESLDMEWPQNEKACRYCSFTDLCWGGEKGLLQIGKKFTPREKRLKVEAISEEVEG